MIIFPYQDLLPKFPRKIATEKFKKNDLSMPQNAGNRDQFFLIPGGDPPNPPVMENLW